MARPPYNRLRELASDWEAEVRHRRADLIAARAMLQATPDRPRLHRPRAAIAVAAAALAGFLGLGAVADGAVPGQVLYPIDRAYESVGAMVGIAEDRSEERLVEALALIERGRDAEAVDLIDEAITHLARRPELQVALLDVPPPTTSTTVPSSTSTTVPSLSATTAPSSTSTTVPAQAPATTAPPTQVAAGPEPPPVLVAAADPSTSLQLATEFLLRTVRDAKRAPGRGSGETEVEDVREAAESVLLASAAIKEQVDSEPTELVAQDTTTSTTTPSTTTTSTTTPSTTTTSTTTTSTTTTTTTPAEDGPGTGPGPIILPPIP
jgi:hypothetical protein